MNIDNAKAVLNDTVSSSFDFYERRPGVYQLIFPLCHEDGDMLEIYLSDSLKGDNYVHICDYGLTLMRLSYTFDINTDTRKRILDSILWNNGVANDGGNLHIDTPLNLLYESILQFAGCVQKVCNMRYWSKETVRSEFYDNLSYYITTELIEFSPQINVSPLPDYPIQVDHTLVCNERDLYLFGVLNNDKAKNVTIALLELQKANLSFISMIIHENMDNIGRKERLYLTNNADTQYHSLKYFEEKAANDIHRLVGSNLR